jgi:hypothetical protein
MFLEHLHGGGLIHAGKIHFEHARIAPGIHLVEPFPELLQKLAWAGKNEQTETAAMLLTEGFNFVKDVPADVRVEILSLIKAVDYPACWQNRGSLTPRVPPIGLKGAFNSR